MSASGQTAEATYALTEAASTVYEGTALSISVATTNVNDSTTVYWGISHGTTVDADFTATTGSLTIQNDAGTFTVTGVDSDSSESDETFTVKLYSDSARTDEVASTGTITLQDLPASRTFEFYYFAYGADITTMRVYWTVGTTANLLWSRTGQYQTSKNDDWEKVTLELRTYAGQTGRIYFVYEEPNGALGYWALDDMYYKNSSNSKTYYDGRTSTNRGKWKHQSTTGYSTLAAARTTVGSSDIAASGANQWRYDTGGVATSQATGPKYALNQNTSTDYIYYNSYNSNNDSYQAMMFENTLTLN